MYSTIRIGGYLWGSRVTQAHEYGAPPA